MYILKKAAHNLYHERPSFPRRPKKNTSERSPDDKAERSDAVSLTTSGARPDELTESDAIFNVATVQKARTMAKPTAKSSANRHSNRERSAIHCSLTNILVAAPFIITSPQCDSAGGGGRGDKVSVKARAHPIRCYRPTLIDERRCTVQPAPVVFVIHTFPTAVLYNEI